MRAKALMVQGTASSVGKSVIVAGLCRLLARQGVRVAPFKSQNMALNSHVTRDGREIGRAQAVQALACGIEPQSAFNPILLKPKGDTISQVIIDGLPVGDLSAAEYHGPFRKRAWTAVEKAYARVAGAYDVVIIEGAGSPAEVNLYHQDIVNMRMAALASAPVLLVADIDKGGALASIVGTLELLTPSDRRRVAALLINKFRGDTGLLAPALTFLEDKTMRPVVGVVPFRKGLAIPEEDTLRDHVLGAKADHEVDIAVIRLPHMSNFTDFDALASEDGIRVRFVETDAQLDETDCIVLPGTKNTVDDLEWLRATGLARRVIDLGEAGCSIIGICGGFQMLGISVKDLEGSEWRVGEVCGLGILPVVTEFKASKMLRQVRGRFTRSTPMFPDTDGVELEGYEIHHGRTQMADVSGRCIAAISLSDGDGDDGYVLGEKLVFGTYIHGLFDNDEVRKSLLDALRSRKGLAPKGISPFGSRFREAISEWANLLSANLDLTQLAELSDMKELRDCDVPQEIGDAVAGILE